MPKTDVPSLLIIDDEPHLREIVAKTASDEGYLVAQAGNIKQARIQIDRQKPDVVVLNTSLPDGDGIELWADLSLPDTQAIFISNKSSVESAIAALRCGGIDYMQKPINMRRLRGVLSELKALQKKAPSRESSNAFTEMIGQSSALQLLRKHIKKVAPTQATVLLVGESGTGKELAAQAIHQASRRCNKPFIPVNCGAISPNLIESELFGHEKGSFTGADHQRKGYFECAAGGTLFLDEVTEMSTALQVRLLRVLETGRFMRVGAHEEIEANVRIIAATNRDPEQAVANGALRKDLYHRLNVFPLQLPTLRDRKEDISLLAEYFLQKLNDKHPIQKQFALAAVQAMQNYSWPGNIRELRNFVYRSYILADVVINGDFIRFNLESRSAELDSDILLVRGMSLADADQQLIVATMAQCGGIKRLAAEMLGISVKTLYNRLEEYEA